MKISIKNSALLLGTAFFLFSCTGEKKAKKIKSEEQKTEIVKVLLLEESQITRKLDLSTVLEAYEKVAVAPSIPGRINKISVDVGSRVSKNQLLVEMDQTQLIQSKLAFENFKVDFNRISALNESDNIAKQKYDEAKAQFEIQKTALDNLQQNTNMRAPFSGIIAEKNYENGELYNPARAILSLIQISTLKAYVNIPESFYPKIKTGMKIDLSADTYPGKTFTATIETVYPTIDPATHSFQVKMKIENGKETLRPGMFCRASLALGKVNVIVMPSQAILKTQGSNERFIFIDNNGTAKRLVVKVGQRFDENVEVISTELKIGDKIVVTGQGRLRSGDKLEIVE